MKKQLLILVLSLISFQVFAQMNISTYFRQDGYWDAEEKEWVVISKDDEAYTFFEFNKDYTMFKHTTATITSAYIIKSHTKDEENEQIELEIVSDVGNKYTMVIDFENNNLRFLYEKEDTLWMVQHSIKKTWFDE